MVGEHGFVKLRPPIGISDFQKLREADATYVDKTALISELVASPIEITLITRPRRFGKTLNLSTLRWFFDRGEDERASMFEGLAVTRDARAMAHFQRHPVVSVTFKDVRGETWSDCWASTVEVMSELFSDHLAVLRSGSLAAHEIAKFEAVLDGDANPAKLARALALLCRWLHQYYGERAVVLIDEYDAPIHAGLLHGYRREAVSFFRDLLSGALKDNPHLYKGVATGILRVAKESIFSGLNNLAVRSILRAEHATAFGFTPTEVASLAALANASDRLEDIRRWYDGYRFGGEVIYNPWSVLQYLGSEPKHFEPYWARTSGNEMVRDLLIRGALELEHLEALLRGESVERSIEEHVELEHLETRADAVWSLLLFAGYLKATDVVYDERGTRAHLWIPNEEVAQIYRSTFADWISAKAGGASRVDALERALLSADAAEFARGLEGLLADTLSYHDVAGRTPERVYHAFVAGLLVRLAPDFDVRSNRESGFGRCDVLVMPRAPGRPGVAMELKVVRSGEPPEAALDAAMAQLRDRDYAAELHARGASPIHELAVAFDGKRVYARAAGADAI